MAILDQEQVGRAMRRLAADTLDLGYRLVIVARSPS
ncbi:hypothetical protein H4W80_001174 [Nonomuraea angiospora]|uniref:Uncharacterized protein n=1 Tax=Nonomuraea angiospora TaxID=46172 RepID=A0ABR9LQI1_9ACTN|nr:hypothetical protein [Nonomuraea angiospora]